MSLTLTVTQESIKTTSIHPVGSITAATAPVLLDAVEKQLPYLTGSLLFDMSGVPMIDSTGIGALVKLKKQVTEKGHGFGLIKMQDTVAKALEIVRMTNHLHCFTDREELDDYLITIQKKMMSSGDDNAGA